MNEEAQRIAIATHCGVEPIVTWRRKEDSAELVAVPGSEDWSDAPDYLNDLNAMHEAEKTLNAVQEINYAGIIAVAVKSRHWNHLGFDCLHATARQRAEAFLRTIGKWEDGK